MNTIEGSGLIFCTVCHAFHEPNLPARIYRPGEERRYPAVPNTREQFVKECEKRGIPVKK